MKLISWVRRGIGNGSASDCYATSSDDSAAMEKMEAEGFIRMEEEVHRLISEHIAKANKCL